MVLKFSHLGIPHWWLPFGIKVGMGIQPLLCMSKTWPRKAWFSTESIPFPNSSRSNPRNLGLWIHKVRNKSCGWDSIKNTEHLTPYFLGSWFHSLKTIRKLQIPLQQKNEGFFVGLPFEQAQIANNSYWKQPGWRETRPEWLPPDLRSSAGAGPNPQSHGACAVESGRASARRCGAFGPSDHWLWKRWEVTFQTSLEKHGFYLHKLPHMRNLRSTMSDSCCEWFSTLCAGRHNEMEEREELFKLFEGCQAVGETTDALDAFRALKKVEIEELMNRVEIPAADFSDYYPHFLILLVLDFLEELVQSQEALARMPESLMATGRLVPEMSTEISVNGKSLVCSKDRAQFGVKGNPVLLCFSIWGWSVGLLGDFDYNMFHPILHNPQSHSFYGW